SLVTKWAFGYLIYTAKQALFHIDDCDRLSVRLALKLLKANRPLTSVTGDHHGENDVQCVKFESQLIISDNLLHNYVDTKIGTKINCRTQ
ncbi:hypothetical protein SFRURICE_007897, partial [Spodoptera frugiperda]